MKSFKRTKIQTKALMHPNKQRKCQIKSILSFHRKKKEKKIIISVFKVYCNRVTDVKIS